MNSDNFFAEPVINSPYCYPRRHWVLEDGQPSGEIDASRRRADFITPIAKPKKQRGGEQQELTREDSTGLSTAEQQYDPTSIINQVRGAVDQWRKIPNPNDWGVTPVTEQLLKHWRHHRFSGLRPFFCQVEAAEVAIYLSEVAPNLRDGRRFLEHINSACEQANPGLSRLALKLATGAGKTTVMAMLIAWQTVNAVRRPASKKFTKGFLVVTPGITIRDRLRVLQPNDPDSYYQQNELVPKSMTGDLHQARIVITNYHAFKLRETQELSKGNRRLLQGRRGNEIKTTETEGRMLVRVMSDLMGMKNILVLNDEAHHCYREKQTDTDDKKANTAEPKLTGDDKKEAEKNREAARVWISGLEAVQRKLGIARVFDLSATPFFLRGSGYAEGTLFPWTMSDFSLMDAIECGIVKLPRVPVADNVPDVDMPKFRNLWTHIGKKMPKKGPGKGGVLDPLKIPTILQSALEALYGNYEKEFQSWREAKIDVPPCFVLVCNNMSTSKLLYDYISGFHNERKDGTKVLQNGRLKLFRNFDDSGKKFSRPRTLLIDSARLESGEALDDNFRKAAQDEIDRFRSEVRLRGDHKLADNLSDQDLLREVMNTVGKAGRLGGETRCVVSVSMLTEGWDANTVTHILGVRAFGTQLLCEQVVGRALRRQSYQLNEAGLFDAEYADVFGIPFDFTSKAVVVPPKPPRKQIHIKAEASRASCEIQFPCVAGYRVALPETQIDAKFTADSTYTITPAIVGPAVTLNEGIIGKSVNISLKHLDNVRDATVRFHLVKHLIEKKWHEPGEEVPHYLFDQLMEITKRWMQEHLKCIGGTKPAQLLYLELADTACERITAGIVNRHKDERPVQAILDSYNPTGSTRHVNFHTSKDCYRTDSRYCHVNFAVCDSGWEAEFCRVLEADRRVVAYVKNHGLGLEVPYRYEATSRRYFPDFIVRIDDDNGDDDLLNLIVEIKGYRGEDAIDKKSTMDNYWIPGVNNLREYGRWAFVELTDVFNMKKDLTDEVNKLIRGDLIK